MLSGQQGLGRNEQSFSFCIRFGQGLMQGFNALIKQRSVTGRKLLMFRWVGLIRGWKRGCLRHRYFLCIVLLKRVVFLKRVVVQSPLGDLAPVPLEEVGVGVRRVWELQSRKVSEVVSENDDGDVRWVLGGLLPVVVA